MPKTIKPDKTNETYPDLSFKYENGVLIVRHLKTTKLLKFTRIDTTNEADPSDYRVSRYRISGA